MPPGPLSRYRFCQQLTDSSGRISLSEREPYRFRDLADNRRHICRQGDTLQSLAERYLTGLPDPAQLWWVIADFQPAPIHDPTLELAIGRELWIPSVRTVTSRIFNPSRQQ